MSKNKLALTEEEKARDLNTEEIKGLLINKAILETAKNINFQMRKKKNLNISLIMKKINSLLQKQLKIKFL